MNRKEYNRTTAQILLVLGITGLILWAIPARFTGPRLDITALVLVSMGWGLLLTWSLCEPREFAGVMLSMWTRRRRRQHTNNRATGLGNGVTLLVLDGGEGPNMSFTAQNPDGQADHPLDDPRHPAWKPAE